MAWTLRERGHHCVAVEIDQHRLETCVAAGLPMVYGDASHPAVLEAVGFDRACLLVITTPAAVTALAIARQRRPELPGPTHQILPPTGL